VRSIRPVASRVSVVYQTVSNFGLPCDPGLLPLLERLRAEGLVDVLIPYTPRDEFSLGEKCERLVSKWMDLAAVGGSLANIATSYLNELCKRQMGLEDAVASQMKYFLSMDCDEFYRIEELQLGMQFFEDNPEYTVSACYMRYFFKRPTCELLPVDNFNMVPFVIRLGAYPPLRYSLGHPYPCVVDPTRCVEGHRLRIKLFSREEVVMYHYSFVRTRRGIQSKVANVSNRQNYHQNSSWGDAFDQWEGGTPPPHPHPWFAKHYQTCQVVENWFRIPDVYV